MLITFVVVSVPVCDGFFEVDNNDMGVRGRGVAAIAVATPAAVPAAAALGQLHADATAVKVDAVATADGVVGVARVVELDKGKGSPVVRLDLRLLTGEEKGSVSLARKKEGG